MEQAKLDPSLWLLTGDIGFSVLEGFASAFPDRFLNVGVAEQNMIGVAAGLAQSGKNVFTYTIGNFSFMRCLEQIRNDVCYHQLNVKVVAVGGGFAYGNLGYTHHAIEDIAMLRVLPYMTVVAPGDPVEAALATKALSQHKGPGYLRLGRGGETVVHQVTPPFTLGKAITLATGSHATIVSSAGTLDIAYDAVQQLTRQGHAVGLLSMPTLSPFDTAGLLEAARNTARLITIEEHGRGGLSSLVLESVNEVGMQMPVRSIYVKKTPSSLAGDRNWLREYHGLTTDAIIAAAGV